MFGNEISDYKQLKAVRQKLDEFWWKKPFLKSLYFCGSKVPPNHSGVAVVRNNKTARFVGNASCKSPWCCPVCTSRQMAKYASKIAVGIDALKERGENAAMITFSIPHTSGFSCEDATEILYNVWKAFTIHGNKIGKSYQNDIFANFMAQTNSKHRVRVTEYTWGNAGWHPHFHTLFWFPRENFQSILEWEERLNKRWLELCKRYTIKQILIGYPEIQSKTVKAFLRKIYSGKVLPDAPTISEQILKLKHLVKVEEIADNEGLGAREKEVTTVEKVITRVNIMYSKLNDISQAVYISKDKNNQVIVQESSNYICGWGANRELVGNVQGKATAEGHFTWQQILENAISVDKHELKPAEGSRKNEGENDAAQVPAEANLNKWWKLYFEYAIATRKYKHARVNFSVHSGLCQIIKDYMKTNAYKITSKKNTTSQVKKYGTWKVVCWFTPSQWLSICNNYLEPDILELAVNGELTEINKLLKAHDLPPAVQNIEATVKLEAILNAA